METVCEAGGSGGDDFGRCEQANQRPKFFVTRDDHFAAPELEGELDTLGFKVRREIGPLFRELK